MVFSLSQIGSIVHVDEGSTWSSQKLKEEVSKRVPVLHQLNVTRGSKVLICHGGSIEFFADLFAIWNVGACAVCLNPALTEDELLNVAEFAEARLALVGVKSQVSDKLSIPAICAVDEVRGLGADLVSLKMETSLDDAALMLFTSGTTGIPKGVVHSFRSLLARTSLNYQVIGGQALDRSLCLLPMHFGHGLIGNSLTPLLAGKELYISSGSIVSLGSHLGDIIDEFGITFMSSVPTFWKLAAKASSAPKGKSLRRVHVGSAPLSSELWNDIITWTGTRDVVNMYGITETANWIGGFSTSCSEPLDGAVGKVWGGNAMVRSSENIFCASGEGEIIVQSPSLMNGYYKLPDLTREVLQGGWFLTGDVGIIEPDGNIRITGRSKYQVNRAGIKVHPEDIDLLLERHHEVYEACAFGYADDIAGQLVGVAVCPMDGVTIDLRALRKWCSSRLVKEKIPDKWFVVKAIPKTERGKINRDKVATYCLEGNDTLDD